MVVFHRGGLYLILLKILLSLLQRFACSNPCVVAVGVYWSLFITTFLALSSLHCFFTNKIKSRRVASEASRDSVCHVGEFKVEFLGKRAITCKKRALVGSFFNPGLCFSRDDFHVFAVAPFVALADDVLITWLKLLTC